MEELPRAVSNKIKDLKNKHRHHIEVHRKGNYFYLFETTSEWVPETMSRKKLSLYIGKLSKSAKFIPPLRKRPSTEGINTLDEYINRVHKADALEEKELIKSEYEVPILKELSTNPREGAQQISKKLGLNYSTTYYWIKRLEEKYGIRYTIEHVFLNKFGFFRFFAVAKFSDKRPDSEALKRVLEDNKYIQLAFLSRGAYDLFIFFLASDPVSAENLIYDLRSNPVLAECPAFWYSSYFTQGIGYIPLRDEFFDVLEERVWRRTKEHPRRSIGQIFLREFATLKELNHNGLIEFSEIDRKYGLKKGSAQYTYHKLLEDEMIFRVTITMDKPPIKDTAVIVINQIDVGKFNKKRTEWLKDVIEESNEVPLNKYIFVGDIGSPYGIIHISPVYKDGEVEKVEADILKITSGIRVETSIISKILVGKLGYRKIDTTKTWVYKTLYQELTKDGKSNADIA
ncbi:MAG: Lrp/AsnC family transcriptional regulator [Candidatus Marsarchaeota archaeon]|jgi:DNA-binding Lrp family transcriptional regulator|nr:Lrp/AsnC family transcriptional regulator [Candidatus Marsarchaeota archaeon]